MQSDGLMRGFLFGGDGNPEHCGNNCSHSFEMVCFISGIF